MVNRGERAGSYSLARARTTCTGHARARPLRIQVSVLKVLCCQHQARDNDLGLSLFRWSRSVGQINSFLRSIWAGQHLCPT